MALTDLATVKEWLGILPSSIDDDTLLERLIDAVSKKITDAIGRAIESTEYDEYYTGYSPRKLALKNYPVTAVDTLTISGEDVPAWTEETGEGYIILGNDTIALNGSYSFRTTEFNNVHIVYTAGYAAIPDDLEQACIDLVALRYRSRDRIGQQSKILAGETVRYSVVDLPPEVAEVVARYKDMAVL